MTTVAGLYARWEQLFPNPDTALLVPAFDTIVANYSQPFRYYHTLDHVDKVLEHLDRFTPEGSHQEILALYLAAWLHDVIYDVPTTPGKGPNEARSAAFSSELLALLEVPSGVIVHAARLILSTYDHVSYSPTEATLADADLAILGSPPDEYVSYVLAVRKEYSAYSSAEWALGRTRMLQSLLSRPHLYNDQRARRLLEERARDNMFAEIDSINPIA
jgi:predicted metal-dependent HD superfamily phosphohydrolase